MSEFGNIEWQRYDADDEATHPDTGKELIIIAIAPVIGYAAGKLLGKDL